MADEKGFNYDFVSPRAEEEILSFWKENKIFEKSLGARKKGKTFVFYEGPPYANGLPGIHHVESRSFKDIILRYKTMQGFFVPRRAGWDTHGLPTEMAVEKELGINSKREIEEKIGIEKFVETAKKNVFTFINAWEKLTERMAYWLDFKNAYVTMANDYIESLWRIVSEISKRKLLREDYRVLPWCARCGTSLSSHELALGYKRIKEESIYVKFPVKGEKDTFFLVWTTTPWTLPGNVALAVNPKVDYVFAESGGEKFILAEARTVVLGENFKIKERKKGKDLIGIGYKSLYRDEPGRVVTADFVSTEDGSGIVHIAPAFGRDDLEAGKKFSLPMLVTVDEEGKMKTPAKPWNGKFIKEADKLIMKDLAQRGLLFKTEIYEHDYPFCWRCETPLMYYAKKSWFFETTLVKKKMLEENSKIEWHPAYLKEGRFGEWLRENVDWGISRERYWGAPLPVWKCERCPNVKVVGSLRELDELNPAPKSGEHNWPYNQEGELDLHKPYVDAIELKCQKCKGVMRRVKEVIDVWFDSGAMPFASAQNQKLEPPEFYPADYICEAIDQTRGWFYTLLAVSSLLGFSSSYKRALSLGLVLDEKGEKMSKSKGNVVDPIGLIEKYGADAVRWYFYTVNQPWDDKLFREKDIAEASRRFLMILWNSYKYWGTYQTKSKLKAQKSKLLINQWILAKWNEVLKEITEKLEAYDIVGAARLIENFAVEDISHWYIRRIREHMKEGSKECSEILAFVLLELSKALAPFTPFIAEGIYKNIGGKKESVHLENFPKAKKLKAESVLIKEMEDVREFVSKALEARQKAGIKIRQPLHELRITNKELGKEFLDLIKGEVNVKEIVFGDKFELDTKITKELKEEGLVREFVRQVQDLRKELKLKPREKAQLNVIGYTAPAKELIKILEKHRALIEKEISLSDFILGELEGSQTKEISVENSKVVVGIKK